MRAAYVWLIDRWQWPAATLFAAGFLALLLPLVTADSGVVIALVYAQLPAYMLHQFEEHHDDRFCNYVNALLAGGAQALSPRAAFVINSVFVWGVDLVSLYLARFVSIGLGLIAVDLALVNAALHLTMAAIRREYNPGVWTALFVFLPLGGWAYWTLVARGATFGEGVLAFAIAVAIHIGIVVHVRRRIAQGYIPTGA